jgi:hypothetical protein
VERVAFLIEETNERIGCLLNPDHLVLRRSAGVRARQSAGGQLTGSGLADDPVLYTGGGRTELECLLLFDVNLGDSTIETEDVRTLTMPLWNLSENRPGTGDAAVAAADGGLGGHAIGGGYGGPRVVRFVWGKSWNVPGIITSVAERLEQFTAEGVPQRSWLSLRLLRVNEPLAHQPDVPAATAPPVEPQDLENLNLDETQLLAHEVKGGGEEGERLDELAQRYYGDPSFWRLIAAFNNIADPMRIAGGTVLRLPPLSALTGTGNAGSGTSSSVPHASGGTR